MKAIEVKQLTKRFGTFTAVDHISFEVEPGEIFGFLGANGAGKTTAMRMLCGLSVPTSGEARVAGFDVYRESESIKRNIGYMSQKFSLYGDLKVWENIRLFGGIYGLSKRQLSQKTDELLDILGLEKERNTLVDSLPLGWKQKLAGMESGIGGCPAYGSVKCSCKAFAESSLPMREPFSTHPVRWSMKVAP